jgi:hypothetical protein
MADPWIAAIASLGGVIVGATATYVTQTSIWRRTARRELYGEFAAQSSLCRDALLNWRYAIKHKPSDARGPSREAAAERMARLASVSAQIGMIASKPTRNAARDVEAHLMSLKNEFYNFDRSGTPPTKRYNDYLQAFADVLDAFVSAAGRELGRLDRSPNAG